MAVERENVTDALLDLTFDAILVRDFATDTIQFWNRGAEDLYGFSCDEVVGRVSHDVLQTIHPAPVDEAKKTLVQTGRWEGELVHIRRDGTRVVVYSRWAVRMDRGRPVAILETNTDITERVQVEQEREQLLARERQARAQAEEAQTRLTLLADASALLASSLDYETTLQSVASAVVPRIADWCAVHLVDEDGTVRQITITHSDPAKVELAREMERRYPYDPDAPAGVPHVLRTGEPELVSELSDELLQSLATDEDAARLARDLGLTSWMVVPLAARGHLLGAITLVAAESGRHYGPEDVALADILARRAALAVDNARLYHEARRVAAEQSAILSQMADGVAMVDPSGQLMFLNEAARRMIGEEPSSSLEAALSRFHIATVAGAPYPLEELPVTRALRDRETTVGARWRLRRADGTEIILQGSATPVVGENGELLGAVSTFRDVTAQVTLEQQKEEFLSAAAHDLKTPLTSLKGLAQILQRRLTRGQSTDALQLQEGLARIEKNASRMTSMINELLDVSRLQMGEELELNRQSTDLAALVAQCVAEYGEAAGSERITFRSSTHTLQGIWDAQRLERVIANLLSNATKYSPEGTPVTVTLEEVTRDGAAWAMLSVEDRGIGIPPDDLPHIFERFRRGRNVGRETLGTGIGLSGVRRIVEQHGGTIEVTSEEGAGSTFTVYLPREQASTGAEADENDSHAG